MDQNQKLKVERGECDGKETNDLEQERI